MSSEAQRPSYGELAGLVAAQASRIAELEAEVAELRRRLGINSTNSSRPPSADGLDKPKLQRSRGEGSGRRRGRQPGAPGSTRRLVDNPDLTLVHRPDWCGNRACGAVLADAVEYARQRRQVFELPPVKPYVTEHQVVSVRCGCCGQVTEQPAPEGVAGRVQYGPGVKAAVAYGRGAQFLPYGRVAGLMGDLLGIQVSVGFAYQVVAEAAARLGPFCSHVAAALQVARVLHADETPARVAGRLRYVHVACTQTLTLLHVGGRSAADVDAGGVLPGFDGVLVRDGYAAYQHLTDADHAWCGAHLLRDLRGVHETDPAGQSWAEHMANTLLIAKKMTEDALAAGQDRLTEQQLGFIGSAYAGAIAQGRAENPPGRAGELSRAGKLVERFATHRNMILRYTVDLAVPFTNNQAEVRHEAARSGWTRRREGRQLLMSVA